MPHLLQGHRKHAQKEGRMRRHPLVCRLLLADWLSLRSLPSLLRQLQGHRAGLREMPNSQVQD